MNDLMDVDIFFYISYAAFLFQCTDTNNIPLCKLLYKCYHTFILVHKFHYSVVQLLYQKGVFKSKAAGYKILFHLIDCHWKQFMGYSAVYYDFNLIII